MKSTKKLSNNSNATASTASKATGSKATASKATASKANTEKATEKDITVSLFSVKNAILNAISSIAFSCNNNNSIATDTADTLLDLLLEKKITKEEYKQRMSKLGKPITNTGDFRNIKSLNSTRVSSNAILSESLLKGKKGDKDYIPPSTALAVYKDNAHYDNVCKLQDILTLLLNIGTDTTTIFTSRDFELALYKTVHVAQSKAKNYNVDGGDTEKAFVDMIKYKKAE